MLNKIYPNDPCPCGSGKKYKKCCKYKLDIPDEKLTLFYWVDYLSKHDLIEEKLQFFETEKKLANNKLCSMIGNIKKCFVTGKISFDEVLEEVNRPCDEYPIVSEYAFKEVFVMAVSQFLAQMNELREEEFINIREKLNTHARKIFFVDES